MDRVLEDFTNQYRKGVQASMDTAGDSHHRRERLAADISHAKKIQGCIAKAHYGRSFCHPGDFETRDLPDDRAHRCKFVNTPAFEFHVSELAVEE